MRPINNAALNNTVTPMHRGLVKRNASMKYRSILYQTSAVASLPAVGRRLACLPTRQACASPFIDSRKMSESHPPAGEAGIYRIKG
ncbi:MAG: hypothetical protein KAI99_15840 [Cyclobacteriaceae bacterium]|nr:hypothetical protein [Cyclobacteriaceae bacterium]